VLDFFGSAGEELPWGERKYNLDSQHLSRWGGKYEDFMKGASGAGRSVTYL